MDDKQKSEASSAASEVGETAPAAGGAAPDEIRVTEAEAEVERGRGGLATLSEIEQEVERAFDRLLKGNWLRPSLWELPSLPTLREAFEGKEPRVNLVDRDHELVVEAELPGVKKSDVEISLAENSITIKASARREKAEESGEFHKRELTSSYSTRTLSLPESVDVGAARASLEDGLLTVTLPKTESHKRRNVPID